MKNFILITLLLISGLVLILESETLTVGIIVAKVISLTYAELFFKANNYFNRKEIKEIWKHKKN